MELTKYKHPHRIYSKVTSVTQLLRETRSSFFLFFFAYQSLLDQIWNSQEGVVEGLQHYPDGCPVYTSTTKLAGFPRKRSGNVGPPFPTQPSVSRAKTPRDLKLNAMASSDLRLGRGGCPGRV